jgi:hypothetical protein
MNHGEMGRLSCEDIVEGIGAQLIDLGHHVERRDEALAMPPYWNILIEGFDDNWLSLLRQSRSQGNRTLMVTTERVTASPGFNWRSTGDMVTRRAAFNEACQLVDAIWCLVPGTAEYIRSLPNAAPAIDIQIGFSPLRLEGDHWLDTPYDVGFFGSPLRRRANVLQRLMDKGVRVKALGHFPKPKDRNKAMLQCKIILHIKAFQHWEIMSNSRIATALHLRRPVLAEYQQDDDIWRHIIQMQPSHLSLVSCVFSMLPNWRVHRERQLREFRQRLSAATNLGPAIKETLHANTSV